MTDSCVLRCLRTSSSRFERADAHLAATWLRCPLLMYLSMKCMMSGCDTVVPTGLGSRPFDARCSVPLITKSKGHPLSGGCLINNPRRKLLLPKCTSPRPPCPSLEVDMWLIFALGYDLPSSLCTSPISHQGLQNPSHCCCFIIIPHHLVIGVASILLLLLCHVVYSIIPVVFCSQ